jgi:hypothetical protein
MTMPWKAVSIMSLRWEFVELANQSSVNFTQLCERFGISRDTGYKWLRRIESKGWRVCRIAVVGPGERGAENLKKCRTPRCTDLKMPLSKEDGEVKAGPLSVDRRLQTRKP